MGRKYMRRIIITEEIMKNLKKILFTIILMCLTISPTLKENVSLAGGGVKPAEPTVVYQKEYGQNYTFPRNHAPEYVIYGDSSATGYKGALTRRRLITIDVTNNTETWYYSGIVYHCTGGSICPVQ